MAPAGLQQQRCSLAGVLSPLLIGLVLISVLTNKRFSGVTHALTSLGICCTKHCILWSLAHVQEPYPFLWLRAAHGWVYENSPWSALSSSSEISRGIPSSVVKLMLDWSELLCNSFGCSLASVMASSWGKCHFVLCTSLAELQLGSLWELRWSIWWTWDAPGIHVATSFIWDPCKAWPAVCSIRPWIEDQAYGQVSPWPARPKMSLSTFLSSKGVLWGSQAKPLLTTAEEQGSMINKKIRVYLSLAQPALVWSGWKRRLKSTEPFSKQPA